ncbi:MAG: hypothetical protein HQL76_11890 [Magnetococcales bacterium]|nr:hypothetical protein [Magnetococcales bacterium]
MIKHSLHDGGGGGLAVSRRTRRRYRLWPGMVLGLFLAVPAWEGEAATVADPAKSLPSPKGGGATAVVERRIGLFEAMGVGLGAGMKERMDRTLQALIALTPPDATPARLREWLETAGWMGGKGMRGEEEARLGEFDPAVVWNLVTLALEKERAPREPGGGEPAPSLVRAVAVTLATDVRAAYWRSATADLLLDELDRLLQEANAALVRLRTPKGTLASADARMLKSQSDLLTTTDTLWKWRKTLQASKETLARLLGWPGGAGAVRVKVAATEMLDPGILALPVVFMEDQALLHWANRAHLPREERLGGAQVERGLMAAFPGHSFPGLGHESVAWAPAGAPSWVEAGMTLTGQLVEGQRPPAADSDTGNRVVRLAQGVATLMQVHLALLECRMTEKRLAGIRDRNKEGLKRTTIRFPPGKEDDPDSSRIVANAEGLILRVLQGLAFADHQVALGRLLMSLGRDPVPPMPGLENLAPPTLTANIAFRHESATAALLAAMETGNEPDVEEQLKMMSGSGGTSDKEGMWQRMHDFSQNKGLSSPKTVKPHDVGGSGSPEGVDFSLPEEDARVPIAAE